MKYVGSNLGELQNRVVIKQDLYNRGKFWGADDRQRLNAAECAALNTSRASGHCIVQLRLSTHRLYMQAASRGAGACISTTLAVRVGIFVQLYPERQIEVGICLARHLKETSKPQDQLHKC